MVLGRAVRTALAAIIAWVVVQPWGGLADQYPYYAPMGAVIAVTATVAGSFRETWRTALAIGIGAVLALLTTPLHLVLQLGVVVGLGTVISGWRRLGDTAGWVPIAGLFVLLFGQGNPWGSPTAYMGLTTLGAAIGLVVNAVWPPLPLGATRKATDRLRALLADQLDILAEALSGDTLPDPDEWGRRVHRIDPVLYQMRDLVATLRDSRRANWRARRWRESNDVAERQAQALDAMAFLVEDVTWFLTDREHAGRDDVAIGPRQRPSTAELLRRVAAVLRSMDGVEVDKELLTEADEALDDLVAGIGEARVDTDDAMVSASGVVSTVGRTLDPLP